MSMSMKNILNKNLPISNSFILNNYSIQNLIISPTKLVTNYKTPLITNNYMLKNKYSYSPSPHKSVIKNIASPGDIHQNQLIREYTPITPYKSTSKLNYLNYRNFPSTPINNISNKNLMYLPKVEKITKTEEKHPQDTKKSHIANNNNQILLNNNKIILKNSISQRLFKNVKKSYGTMHNLGMNHISKANNELDSLNKINNDNNKNELTHSKTILMEPKGNLLLEEYQFAEAIGKGTFGKIFCVRWIRNNKLYALKKEILTDKENIEKRKDAFKIIRNFIKNTKSKGVVQIYGNLLLKNKIDFEYHYYELMEKAERDWDQEINIRSQYNLYYKENEIINIMKQLIFTLSLLQKNHITHRDIKPQNILIINGRYKLCDFGEIRVLERNGLIVQRVRGSELYMSPILFHGLHLSLIQVRHNTYKSDVFSLGMCLFYASSLTYVGVDSIRELTNMKKIKDILFKHLGKRYSSKYIMFILQMLEVNEEKRPDFIQLEMKIKKFFT